MDLKKILSPKRIWFHLLLATGITILIVVIFLISLHFFTRHGQEVEMPNFVGQDSKELIANSLSYDFIFVVSDYIYDKNSKPGLVLKQNPEANGKTMVKKGRKVYLTVASPIPPKVKMPELKDVSLRQAEIMLKAIDLQLGDVIYKPSPFENAVFEQLYKGRAIAPGTEISVGETIALVVGRNVDNLPDSIPPTNE